VGKLKNSMNMKWIACAQHPDKKNLERFQFSLI
jgi:hypothetical protein